jgi:hypothetical protein
MLFEWNRSEAENIRGSAENIRRNTQNEVITEINGCTKRL